MKHTTALIFAALLSTSPALAQYEETAVTTKAYYPLTQRADDSFGRYVTDHQGMAVYLYKQDKQFGKVSNCYDKCAKSWPPVLLNASVKKLLDPALKKRYATITRKDGRVQLTYNGWPLYYWAGDQQAGDTNGHEVGDVWFLLKP